MADGPVLRVRGAFVGRDRELADLLAGLDEAVSGHGVLVLVGGEPGIGKSRLADELAARARERGIRVLSGRCWEGGGAPAFWPWVQCLRSYLRDRDAAGVAAEVGSGAADLARIMPELREALPGLPDTPAADPDTARFRLFDAATRFLRGAADREPLVLVLDDLHVADEPSLVLLRFLAPELADARILVVGTYRDAGLGRDHPLTATLAELVRHRSTRRIALRGLTEADVARFVELTTGVAPPPGLVSAVHAETEGNPLFVGEVVRLLAMEGRLEETGHPSTWKLALPPGVREVIGRRLSHLSERCTAVLTLASVMGREFWLDALERASGLPADDLLDVLDEAVAARLVTEAPSALGRLRFSHALVRDAIYEEIPAARRIGLHRRMGEVLERLYGRNAGPHLAELAHHFTLAAPGGDVDRATHYARRAGDRAAGLLAFEEAARLYRMGLEALGLREAADEELRCELLLALGDALARAGEGPGAKGAFLQAADIARELDLPERLAPAALGYGGSFAWLRPGGDIRIIPLLEEALAALGAGDGALRVRLLARLAGALRDQPSREPRASLSGEAVDMARRVGDPATLAYALVARYTANWGPENVEEQLAIATELIQLAERIGDLDRALEGHLLRHKALMTLGDMPAVRAELAACTHLADELGQPTQRWYPATDRATLALLEGRFDQADGLIQEALRLGRRALGGMEAEVAFRLQTYALRREQGRLEEVEEPIRKAVDEFPGYPMFRCVLAHLQTELGRATEARLAFEDLAADRFAALPMDNEWLFGMSFLPEVADRLEDGDRAAVLYELLLPFAGLNAQARPSSAPGPWPDTWGCWPGPPDGGRRRAAISRRAWP